MTRCRNGKRCVCNLIRTDYKSASLPARLCTLPACVGSDTRCADRIGQGRAQLNNARRDWLKVEAQNPSDYGPLSRLVQLRSLQPSSADVVVGDLHPQNGGQYVSGKGSAVLRQYPVKWLTINPGVSVT